MIKCLFLLKSKQRYMKPNQHFNWPQKGEYGKNVMTTKCFFKKVSKI